MLNPFVSFIYYLLFAVCYFTLRKKGHTRAKSIVSAFILSCVIGTVFVVVGFQLGLRLYLTI
jgi:Kef-type K+ transport system membrane component KefB